METKIAKHVNSKISTPRRIFVGPAQKGLMQRFIKTRAQSLVDSNNNCEEKSSPIKSDALLMKMGSPITSRDNKKLKYHLSIYSPKPIQIPNNDSPIIERDENGKPIRRGYVSAKDKIQIELNDFRNREAELRKSRRSCPSNLQPDLVASINDSNDFTEEYRRLKSSTSVSELSDSIDSVFSDFSDIVTPNSSFNYHRLHRLPQRRSFPSTVKNLFDEIYSKPEEDEQQMSSKNLIAKWETIIKESSRK